MPKYDYVVTLEVTQLDLKLEMVVGVTMTVRSLKARLQRERGFPVDRTDLLFRDEPMENQRHLFDYHVTHGATLFAMLHLVYDIRVTVGHRLFGCSLMLIKALALFKGVLIFVLWHSFSLSLSFSPSLTAGNHRPLLSLSLCV